MLSARTPELEGASSPLVLACALEAPTGTESEVQSRKNGKSSRARAGRQLVAAGRWWCSAALGSTEGGRESTFPKGHGGSARSPGDRFSERPLVPGPSRALRYRPPGAGAACEARTGTKDGCTSPSPASGRGRQVPACSARCAKRNSNFQKHRGKFNNNKNKTKNALPSPFPFTFDKRAA